MKFFNSILFIFIFLTSNSHSDDNFNKWLLNYKQFAINQGVTKKTVDEAFKNTKLLKRIQLRFLQIRLIAHLQT